MKLPVLRHIARTRSAVSAFNGYNHTPACAEGEWYEESNLSARNWPALSPRLPRTRVQMLKKPHGLYAKNGLLWVDGTTLFYNGRSVGTVADSDKTFCGIGAKVLIWPDKVYLNTTDQTLHPLGAKWASVGDVSFTPAREDGAACTVKTTGATEPENPANGDYWLDTGGTADVLRVYSTAQGAWAAVSTPYVKIAAPGIGTHFAENDTVTLTGAAVSVLGEAAAARLNTDLIVWSRTDDSLVVTGLLEKAAVQSHAAGEITVERRIPDLDYLTESDNRVWGCCSADHTVYACKLGDPTNWYSYMGTAADSYAATVGSDGDFTGAAACLGYVLFFKENLIHKLYGTKPANYQLTTVACRGVKQGAARSLVPEGDTLYYLSADGIMRYDGSLPVCVSKNFGTQRFSAGVAGAAHGEVHFSLMAPGGWQNFCCDTAHEFWHKEDGGKTKWFAAAGGTLYALAEDGGLWALGCENDPYSGEPGQEKSVAWCAESGEIGLYTPDHKFVSRIELRLESAPGMRLKLEAAYDGGRWEMLTELYASCRRTMLVPVIPRRCTFLKLRLSGCGGITLYSVTKILEQGSEL